MVVLGSPAPTGGHGWLRDLPWRGFGAKSSRMIFPSSTTPHAVRRRHPAGRPGVLHLRPPGAAATARRLRLLSPAPAPQVSARAPAVETREERSGVDQRTAQSLSAWLEVRVIRYAIEQQGFGTKEVFLATTLLDEQAWPDERLRELYGQRWHIRRDICR